MATDHVMIIGAGGVFGGLAARAFHDAGWKVRCASRTPGVRQPYVDLDDPRSVVQALRENELVVNTVPHPGLVVERAVLERGGTLINTSALPAAAGRSLRAVAAGAQGTVLMHAGLAPGVTTVVATDLLRRHAEADELEMVFTLSSTAPRGPASADFIHRGLTGMATHRTAVIPLPSPFGERRCPGFAEVDAGWLGGVAEGRIVRCYLCILEPAAHRWLLWLNRSGAMATLPRARLCTRTQPAEPARHEPVAHWVAVKRRERRLAAHTVQCHGDLVHAVASTLVFAGALRARQLQGGCFDPGELFTVADVESRLRESGVRIIDRS